MNRYFIYPFTCRWTFVFSHFLATVNSAAMNIHGHFLIEHLFSVLLGRYLGVEVMGHMVTLFNFLGSSQRIQDFNIPEGDLIEQLMRSTPSL